MHALAERIVNPAGQTLRFCQQCGRLHNIGAFDGEKRWVGLAGVLGLDGEKRWPGLAGVLGFDGEGRGAAIATVGSCLGHQHAQACVVSTGRVSTTHRPVCPHVHA